MNTIDEIQQANEERKGNILKSFGVEGETIEKAKYIRRTGSPGNYKYEYTDDKKGVEGKKSDNKTEIRTRISEIRARLNKKITKKERKSLEIEEDRLAEQLIMME